MKKMNARQILFLIRMDLVNPTLLDNWKQTHKTNPQEVLDGYMELQLITGFLFGLCVLSIFLWITPLTQTKPSTESMIFVQCSLALVFSLFYGKTICGHGRKFVHALNDLNQLLTNTHWEDRGFYGRYHLHLPFNDMKQIAYEAMKSCGSKLCRYERAVGPENAAAVKQRRLFKSWHRTFFPFGLVEANQGKYMPPLESKEPAELTQA